MPDQRPHRRYKVEFMDITGAVIQENNTEIIDLSISGISLQIKRRLNVGEQYTIKFYALDKVLNLRAAVIWSKISKSQRGPHGDTIPIYTAGLEFQDLSKDTT